MEAVLPPVRTHQSEKEAPDGDGDKRRGICVIDSVAGGKENRRQQPCPPITEPGRHKTAPEETSGTPSPPR